MYGFLATVLFFSSLAQAELPAAVVREQTERVHQGNCEVNWRQIEDPQVLRLDSDYTLYLVPCAQWSIYNLAWSVYVQVREPANPEGFLIKPILFVTYSQPQQVYADHSVYNFTWESETQSLRAFTTKDGRTGCGVVARYQWDRDQQNFRVTELLKKDDCRNPMAPWTWLIGDKKDLAVGSAQSNR